MAISSKVCTVKNLQTGTIYLDSIETKLHEIGFHFLSFFFPEPGAPPVLVRGHNSSSTSISVTWGKVPDDKQHGDISHYTVIYEKKEGGTEKRKTVTTRTAELKDLEKFTEYSIKVLAATRKGDGPPSDPIIVQTDQDSKCSYSPQRLLLPKSSQKPTRSSPRLYLNNRVFLARNYRPIVAPRKFDVLKTNICPRSEASRAYMPVIRTSNFSGATIISFRARSFRNEDLQLLFLTFHDEGLESRNVPNETKPDDKLTEYNKLNKNQARNRLK